MFITYESIGKARRYLNDKHSDLFNLRSAAKSIISILAGIAIDRGYIKSIEDRVLDYLPQGRTQISDERWKDLKIEHLLTMKSGIPPIESGGIVLKMILSDGDWVKFILDLLNQERNLFIIQPILTYYLR